MKSKKCTACGFVGWSDGGNCKGCGASLAQQAAIPSQASPVHIHEDPFDDPEAQVKTGLAVFALVLGIISILTFGLLGIGALTGIIVAIVAMGKVKREPWRYGGRGMAVAGLVLSITSLVAVVPFAMVAAIAIPNLFAARMAANEGSSIYSLRMISEAEARYYDQFQKYASLEELASEGMLEPALGRGVRNGYKFSVEVKTLEPGFEAFSVPVTYQSTGRRSFYMDETAVIRVADNRGGPSSKLDQPLDADFASPVRSQRRGQYNREVGY